MRTTKKKRCILNKIAYRVKVGHFVGIRRINIQIFFLCSQFFSISSVLWHPGLYIISRRGFSRGNLVCIFHMYWGKHSYSLSLTVYSTSFMDFLLLLFYISQHLQCRLLPCFCFPHFLYSIPISNTVLGSGTLRNAHGTISALNILQRVFLLQECKNQVHLALIA